MLEKDIYIQVSRALYVRFIYRTWIIFCESAALKISNKEKKNNFKYSTNETRNNVFNFDIWYNIMVSDKSIHEILAIFND